MSCPPLFCTPNYSQLPEDSAPSMHRAVLPQAHSAATLCHHLHSQPRALTGLDQAGATAGQVWEP